MDNNLPKKEPDDKPRGLYGRNITTAMRQELSWRAVYLYDLFEGLWRSRRPVRLSNRRIANEFGWSVGTVKRAISELSKHDYIDIVGNTHQRQIVQPTRIVIDSDDDVRITGDPSMDHPRSKYGSPMIHVRITGDPHKTLEDKTLEGETGEVEGEPPPDSDEWDSLAGEKLTSVNPVIEGDNRYITSGKRPLKAFTRIWITPGDLAAAFRTMKKEGLPPERFVRVFEKVDRRLADWERKHKQVIHVDCYQWLIGWALYDELKNYRTKMDTERSAKYLEKAKGVA